MFWRMFVLFQWREEDAEFAKDQARRAKEGRERRRKKNMLRRMRGEIKPLKDEDGDDGDDGDVGQEKGSEKYFVETLPKKENEGEGGLSVALKSLFCCTNCSSMLPPPAPLYQVRLISPLNIIFYHHQLHHLLIYAPPSIATLPGKLDIMCLS